MRSLYSLIMQDDQYYDKNTSRRFNRRTFVKTSKSIVDYSSQFLYHILGEVISNFVYILLENYIH